MKYKYFLVFVLLFFITGCGEMGDGKRIKMEYEEYNKTGYVEVNIDEDNIFQYNTNEEINHILSSGTGVIFIGSEDDNLSRCVMNLLVKVSNHTDIQVIHYNKDINSVSKYIDEEVKRPVVLFVIDGKLDSYHIGTVDNKEVLSSDEEVLLYNLYLDGVHKVLDDVCDERC